MNAAINIAADLFQALQPEISLAQVIGPAACEQLLWLSHTCSLVLGSMASESVLKQVAVYWSGYMPGPCQPTLRRSYRQACQVTRQSGVSKFIWHFHGILAQPIEAAGSVITQR